jgi:hypothetical protein
MIYQLILIRKLTVFNLSKTYLIVGELINLICLIWYPKINTYLIEMHNIWKYNIFIIRFILSIIGKLRRSQIKV